MAVNVAVADEAHAVRLLLAASRAQVNVIERTIMRQDDSDPQKVAELLGYWLIHRREQDSLERRLAGMGDD